jgi:cation diffusion facilitator CzcD-associated flavoprotein CzcO
MSTPPLDVAIIGAGPNGLGLASFLRHAGIEHRIFGSPMATWRAMPDGMYLKSLGFATTIPTPRGYPSFPEYCRARGLEDYEPIEFATFADYGMRLQQELVPEVEAVDVVELTHSNSGFALTLRTGEQLVAKRVVVAVGLTYFPNIPEVLRTLPNEFIEHTWGEKDFSSYAGKDIIVVGRGSSALETATLLHEHGAQVRVVARGEIAWGGRTPREADRPLVDRVKLPLSSLGHGRENWVLQHAPGLMYHVPSSRRLPFTRRHLGPAPAWWLRERAADAFTVQACTKLTGASASSGRVHLNVTALDGTEQVLVTDHIIVGTGYVFDVDRIAFLDSSVAGRVRRHQFAPALSRNFESSLNGLYFVGPVAAESFGPLVRFVAGAPFAVKRIAGHLSRLAGRSSSFPRPLAVSSAAARPAPVNASAEPFPRRIP